MIIIGIDPGTNNTGYGVVKYENQSFRLIECGAITPGKNESFQEKLLTISKSLTTILKRLRPDVAVVEDIFYAVNPKSALKLGHVRGTIILSAMNSGLKVVELTPREIKSGVTGYGQADKNQVAEMVRIILNLQQKPEPEDAADALAAAIAYAMRSDFDNKIAVYKDE